MAITNTLAVLLLQPLHMLHIPALRLPLPHPLQLVPLVPLGLALKVHEAGSRGVDVADGALFVQGVQGEEVGVGGARLEGFGLFGGLFECSLHHVLISTLVGTDWIYYVCHFRHLCVQIVTCGPGWWVATINKIIYSHK